MNSNLQDLQSRQILKTLPAKLNKSKFKQLVQRDLARKL